MGKDDKLYIGLDVGGTKILGALIDQFGVIIEEKRISSPADSSSQDILNAIFQVIEDILTDKKLKKDEIQGIGLAIPGVVDPNKGKIIVTPNMNLSGLEVFSAFKKKFDVPVAIGNDVNAGILGEQWLGATKSAQSAIGVFVGTGIGGGIIYDGKLVRGYHELAGELGHMIMEMNGPYCGCGNRGCLEALAGRWAIERDIRNAVAAGRKTILLEMLEGDLKVIKSGKIKKALAEKDALVNEVMQKVSEVLGYACITLRHVFDPEVIVLGGGVIEACGDFMMPIIERIVATDKFPGVRANGKILPSALGDQAVILGAVALVKGLKES